MVYLKNKIEVLKWLSTALILLNMVLASLTFIPLNFIPLAIGTLLYFIVGYLTNDKPLMTINFAGCILATISFFVN